MGLGNTTLTNTNVQHDSFQDADSISTLAQYRSVCVCPGCYQTCPSISRYSRCRKRLQQIGREVRGPFCLQVFLYLQWRMRCKPRQSSADFRKLGGKLICSKTVSGCWLAASATRPGITLLGTYRIPRCRRSCRHRGWQPSQFKILSSWQANLLSPMPSSPIAPWSFLTAFPQRLPLTDQDFELREALVEVRDAMKPLCAPFLKF